MKAKTKDEILSLARSLKESLMCWQYSRFPVGLGKKFDKRDTEVLADFIERNLVEKPKKKSNRLPLKNIPI